MSRKIVTENPEEPVLVGGLPDLDAKDESKSPFAAILDQLQGSTGTPDSKPLEAHEFWKTQPVAKMEAEEQDMKEGPIEPNKKKDEIRDKGIPLPKEFVWDTVDIEDEAQLEELYTLLTNHYVEDVQSTFRFDYSRAFLKWALQPPGMKSEWLVGMRTNDERHKLVGFIAGTPIEMRIRTSMRPMIEINFLCVHKKLRSLRLAPIVIKEVTRRAHANGVFQAVYTGGTLLPTPVSKCQYFHRMLNGKKLVDVGFCPPPKSMTKFVQSCKVPSHTIIPGLRPIQPSDVKQASRLLRDFLSRFDLAPVISTKEFQHMMVSGSKKPDQVTWTYVVEDEHKKITDIFMFYELPSSAVKKGEKMRAAYLSYYATNVILDELQPGSSTQPTPGTWINETSDQRHKLQQRLTELVGDALVIAAKEGFDVMNALTLMDNRLFLRDLQFGPGDGTLYYYLYNYNAHPIPGGVGDDHPGSGIGLVML